MSMAFDTYKPALLTWVETYGSLPAAGAVKARPLEAVWQHEQRPWVGKARALLRMHTTRSRGVDQVKWDQDVTLPAGADMVPTVFGVRELTLSILVETRDQTAAGDAQVHLERLRTSLRLPTVQAAFRAAGLAFAASVPVVNLDEVVQNRMESRAVLDVFFNAIAELTEPTSSADSYVEKVETSADFDTGDGTGPSWDDVEMP